MWPQWPVDLVCWLWTRRPQMWCIHLWTRIFFSSSRSSQSLLSRPLARTWLYCPSFMSFCLFKNQTGILYWHEFCIWWSCIPPHPQWALLSSWRGWCLLSSIPHSSLQRWQGLFSTTPWCWCSTCKMCWNVLGIPRDMAAVAMWKRAGQIFWKVFWRCSCWDYLQQLRVVTRERRKQEGEDM